MTSTSQTVSPRAPAQPTAAARAPFALLVLSMALLLLALFQWMELLVVRAGGSTVCAVNATVNCERVWDSPFALRVHALTHVPVAGWGLVFAATAFTLSLLFTVRRLVGKPESTLIAALQWTSLAGMFSCLVFAFASARVGALCLTCLSTYALTFGFAAVAFLLLPMQLLPPTPSALDGLLWAGGVTVVGFLLALYPGQHTPHGQGSALPAGVTAGGGEQAPATLQALVTRLSPDDLQTLSDAIAEYQRSTPATTAHAPRLVRGPANAPVQVVEFTDILCPHCRHFTEALEQVGETAPPNTLSVEPRQYPLDHDCNPFVSRSDNTGTHCLAARALICLEASPAAYWKVSAALFEHQSELNPDQVRVLINGAGVDVPALDACMGRPETEAKLAEDEQYAQELHIRGTPLVIVNHRESFPAPVFLYALALAKGSFEQLAALSLPPPRPLP